MNFEKPPRKVPLLESTFKRILRRLRPNSYHKFVLIVLRKREMQNVSKKKRALEDTFVVFNLLGNNNWGAFCCFLVLFLPGSLISENHNFLSQGSLIAYLNIKNLIKIGKTVSIKDTAACQ